jgi:putative oxidoreductase
MPSIFRLPSDKALAAGLFLLRTIVGVVLLAHGGQKLFTMGLSGVEQGFDQMAVPLPHITAPLISILELVGGILLIFGLLTRVFAFLFACDMAGAIVFVHLAGGFFLPTGYEFALLIGVLAIVLLITGAGPWSLDWLIAKKRMRAAPA